MKQLLDFIAEHESEGAARRLQMSAYDIIWGGIKGAHRPPKPLTQMTIREVLAWQDRIDPMYRSEAAGRYQILEDTLRGLYAEAGMTLDSKFDKAGQDRLAMALLKRRGVDRFLHGYLSVNKFCNELAKEWASLPVVDGPKKGRSYYAGDGLNAAGVDVEPFVAVVQSMRPKVPPVSNVVTASDLKPVDDSKTPVSYHQPVLTTEFQSLWTMLLAWLFKKGPKK
jgi:muramidase (phage lysozyme)